MAAITLGAILGAIGTAASIALKTFLDLVKHLGFPAYWLVITALLYADMVNAIPLASWFLLDAAGGGNFFGALLSAITRIFFGIEITTTMLFAMSLCSGLIYFLWKSKEGITVPYRG